MIKLHSMRYSLLTLCLLSLLAVTCLEPDRNTEKEVTSISLSQETAEMVIGETVQLQATIKPTNAVYDKIIWASSRQFVASVNDEGLVTALAEGASTITASAGGKSVTCHVTVENNLIPVESVSLDKTSLSMTKGVKDMLVATVLPENATNQTVSWSSSDEGVVTVDKYGRITASGGGNAIVTAKAGEKTANCLVSVVVPVEGVKLDRTSLIMDVGEIVTLVATVMPEDATDKNVKWSSSNSPVIAVDGFGNVTALKEGETIITARVASKTATCAVYAELKPVPVSSLELDRHEISLEKGQTTTLIANVSPAEATDKTVTWSSSDPSVATVDEEGRVIACEIGKTTIRASAGAGVDYCDVTVKESVIPVTSVTLDRTTLSLEKGQTATLTATVYPSNATDQNVTWSSSDATIASVENGVVTALKGGNTAIMAAAGEKSAVCLVSVSVPVRSIALDTYLVSLMVGESKSLTATISPSDATDKDVRWTSSDPSVVTVSSGGRISGVKKGSASVSASAGGAVATCQVEVSNMPFTIDPSSVNLPGGGGSFTVTVTCSSTYTLKSVPTWVVHKSKSGEVHTFEVAANPAQEERNDVILFCDDEGVCLACSVKQAAGGDFSISPAQVSIGAAGGTFEVKVSCSTDYHINDVPLWIKDVSDNSSIQQHKFQVTRNTDVTSRVGVITFCDDGGVCLSCTVTQKNETEGASGGNEDVPDGEPINW